MSRSWRESARVVLSPQRVDLMRRRGWLSRGQDAKESRAVAVAASGEPWLGSIEELERVLQGAQWTSARLNVVLSSQFVRFQLVPWQADLRHTDERLAYARYLFKEVYGAMSEGWEIRLSEEPPGAHSLACAIDHALLEALRRAAAAGGCRLRSVQPRFVEAFNHLRRGLRGDSVIFAFSEPGRLCAGHLRKRTWRALRNEAEPGRAGAALPAVLGQLALAEEEPIGNPNVYWADAEGATAVSDLQLRCASMDGLLSGRLAWDA